jgi:hypothetical protein
MTVRRAGSLVDRVTLDFLRALLRAELVGLLSDGDRFRLGYRLSQGTILLADDVFEARR